MKINSEDLLKCSVIAVLAICATLLEINGKEVGGLWIIVVLFVISLVF